jgi:hypothetical protein
MKKDPDDIISTIIAIIFWVCILFYGYIHEWIGNNWGKTAQNISLSIIAMILIISALCHDSIYSTSDAKPLNRLITLIVVIVLGILALKMCC